MEVRKTAKRIASISLALCLMLGACLLPLGILTMLLSPQAEHVMSMIGKGSTPLVMPMIVIALLCPWWFFLFKWLERESKQQQRRQQR